MSSTKDNYYICRQYNDDDDDDDDASNHVSESVSSKFPLGEAKERDRRIHNGLISRGYKATDGHDWTVVALCCQPQWLQINEFMFNCHRPPLDSYKECFKSIFRIHSETGNIWTHLIGCVLFAILAMEFVLSGRGEFEWQDRMAFAGFLFGACSCYGMSTLYHICCCHSLSANLLFSSLDYVGITFNVVGNAIPWLHYVFYCSEKLKLTYMAVTLVLSLFCIVFSKRANFSDNHLRWFRACIFVSLGLAQLIPCLHSIIAYGWSHMVNYCGFRYIIVGCSLYLLGAMVYALCIPECMFPGKFDLWFNGHQLFHVFSVTGTLVLFNGLLVAASNNKLRVCL